MPVPDFYEFFFFEQMEPFADRRGDIQAGIIAAMIANSHRTKSTDKIFGPKDFIPDWDPAPPKEQTPEQQMQMMRLIQQVQNARVEAEG